jgi:hypothetical protein
MFETFVPSLIIAASAVAAFAIGRLIAWAASRSRWFGAVRVAAITLAAGAAMFFWFSPSSRYALLLPLGLVLGFLTQGRRAIAPGLFDSKR